MAHLTPISALLGGALIGAAAALLLWLDGRIAGVSGITHGIFNVAYYFLSFVACYKQCNGCTCSGASIKFCSTVRCGHKAKC